MTVVWNTGYDVQGLSFETHTCASHAYLDLAERRVCTLDVCRCQIVETILIILRLKARAAQLYRFRDVTEDSSVSFAQIFTPFPGIPGRSLQPNLKPRHSCTHNDNNPVR